MGWRLCRSYVVPASLALSSSGICSQKGSLIPLLSSLGQIKICLVGHEVINVYYDVTEKAGRQGVGTGLPKKLRRMLLDQECLRCEYIRSCTHTCNHAYIHTHTHTHTSMHTNWNKPEFIEKQNVKQTKKKKGEHTVTTTKIQHCSHELHTTWPEASLTNNK